MWWRSLGMPLKHKTSLQIFECAWDTDSNSIYIKKVLWKSLENKDLELTRTVFKLYIYSCKEATFSFVYMYDFLESSHICNFAFLSPIKKQFSSHFLTQVVFTYHAVLFN